MSKKEAYRYMCHLFHDKGPSKKKIQKQLAREQLEVKLKNMDVNNDSKFVKYLKSEQQKTNNAYVIIQKKNNNP